MPVIPLGSDTSNWVQNPDGTWGPPQHVWGPPHLGGSPSGPIIPGPNYGPPHAGGSPSGPIIPGTTLNNAGTFGPPSRPDLPFGWGGMPSRPATGAVNPGAGGLPPIAAAQAGTVGGDDPLGTSVTYGASPQDPLGWSVTAGAPPPTMPARPATGLPAGPLTAPGGGIGSDANFPTGAPPGMGGIGSDANFPVAPAAAPRNPLANAPLPPPRPKGRIDPKKVNLGYGAPFTTVARPNADPTNPMRGGAPLATALDLSALFRRRQA